MQNDPLIRFDSVHRHFKGRTQMVEVFRDLSLAIDAGEVIAIRGPNGAGKTTFLKLIAGLVTPDSGSVTIRSADGGYGVPSIRPGLVSGVLDGSRGLYWKLTTRENGEYFLGLQGVGRSASRAAIGGWLETFGISAKTDELVETLSRGTQQKVSLAIALAQERPVLLLDEPTVILDDDSRALLAEAITHRRSEGKTTLVASHDADFCARVSTRTYQVEGYGLKERTTAR
jgi:ABC-2 type transport system ATP-binding protein